MCVKVAIPAGAAEGDSSTTTVTAKSVGSPADSGTSTLKTIAAAKDTLLVDEDGNGPDVQSVYATALNANDVSFGTWDLAADPNLPLGYLKAHKNVDLVHREQLSRPDPAVRGELKSFLDGGGNLFMSGQDILDQAAGTTAFVHDYLHITWDGTETQNDKATATVTASPATR